MAKVALYNQEGNTIGEVELNDAIFGVSPNKSLVHQVFLAMEANAREPWAHTKDRGEVRGGGRKPWKQKGTGRARHGSNRSPIWTGGGITFGPLKIRNYKQKINRKMKQAALTMCLSSKVKENKFIVLDALESDGKTKKVAELRTKLPGFGKTTLLVSASKNPKLNLATRNVERFDMQRVDDLNVGDILTHQFVIMTKSDVEAIENRLAKK